MSEELQMGRFLLSFRGILIVLLRKHLDFAFGFGVSWNSKPSSVDASGAIPAQVLQVTAGFQKSCLACSKIQIFQYSFKRKLSDESERTCFYLWLVSEVRPVLFFGGKPGGPVPLGCNFGLVL